MVPEVAAKVALVCPDVIAMLVGTESNPLPLTRDTITVLLAAEFKATVQVLGVLLAKVEGEQASELSWAGALPVAVSANVRETPLQAAVSTAVWLDTTAATVVLKVALLSPAPMLTLPGTVTLVLLLCSATVTALEVAAVSVTEQMAVPGELTVAGVQAMLLSCVTAVRLMDACWLCPLRVAVTVALWLLLTVPEAAANVALLWPEATTTLAGTVSVALLLASVTVAALAAALFRVTVQVLDALLPKVEGAQASELSCAGALAVTVKVCEAPFRVAVSSAA